MFRDELRSLFRQGRVDRKAANTAELTKLGSQLEFFSREHTINDTRSSRRNRFSMGFLRR